MNLYNVQLIRHNYLDLVLTDDAGQDNNFRYFKEASSYGGVSLNHEGVKLFEYSRYKIDSNSVIYAYDPEGRIEPLILGPCKVIKR